MTRKRRPYGIASVHMTVRLGSQEAVNVLTSKFAARARKTGTVTNVSFRTEKVRGKQVWNTVISYQHTAHNKGNDRNDGTGFVQSAFRSRPTLAYRIIDQDCWTWKSLEDECRDTHDHPG